MIWRLFKKAVHVRPDKAYPVETPDSDVEWITWEGRYITSLWEDLRLFGVGVFWHNLLFVLLNREVAPIDK